MQGYSPKLPLVRDDIDGVYSMNKTLLESVKQDFKMLILTNPGERIMMPDFGVGLRQLLFSQNDKNLRDGISSRVYNQVRKYLNFINVSDIFITEINDNSNSVNVKIKYSIPSLKANQELNISLESN